MHVQHTHTYGIAFICHLPLWSFVLVCACAYAFVLVHETLVGEWESVSKRWLTSPFVIFTLDGAVALSYQPGATWFGVLSTASICKCKRHIIHHKVVSIFAKENYALHRRRRRHLYAACSLFTHSRFWYSLDVAGWHTLWLYHLSVGRQWFHFLWRYQRTSHNRRAIKTDADVSEWCFACCLCSLHTSETGAQ